jgi:heme-degrading monooxygenase HmoA
MTTPVVSIHEYELAPEVDADRFERVVAGAERDGLFDLPGLEEYRLLRGIKGARDGEYAAVWTYESRAAWEALWGPPGEPAPPEEYPDRWREW